MSEQELKEIILDLFSQGTSRTEYKDDGTKIHWYDHGFLSTYEHTQDKLIEWGMIKESECYRK